MKKPRQYLCLKCWHWTRTKDGKKPRRCGKCKSVTWDLPRTRKPAEPEKVEAEA